MAAIVVVVGGVLTVIRFVWEFMDRRRATKGEDERPSLQVFTIAEMRRVAREEWSGADQLVLMVTGSAVIVALAAKALGG